MQDRYTGPQSVFSGAGTVVVTRYVKTIQVIEPAVFATLTFKFPTTETDTAAATVPTYPAFFEIYEVASFKLTSGKILVTFGHGK